MMLIGPMILKYVVDDLNQGRDQITREKVLLYALLILGVALVGGVFRFGQRRLIGGVARRIEYELRGDFFKHLQKMQKSYFDQMDTGDLMSRATNDLDAVHRLLGFAIIFIADATVFFGFALVIMLRIDVTLTMLALIPYPILAVLVQLISKNLHNNFERIQEGFSKMNTKVQENLSGVRVVRAYTLEQSEIEEFDRQNLNFVSLNQVFIRLEAIFFPIFRLLPGIGAIVLLWLGGLHVMQGKIMLGDFVAFNAYLSMLIRPVIMLGFIVNRFAQGTASIDRINLILNHKPEICDEEGVDEEEIKKRISDQTNQKYEAKTNKYSKELMNFAEKRVMLYQIDKDWRDHLAAMDSLRGSVNLRALGGKDPYHEYRKESFSYFDQMLSMQNEKVIKTLFNIELVGTSEDTNKEPKKINASYLGKKIPRNSTCPCGSGKKYKHCHGS